MERPTRVRAKKTVSWADDLVEPAPAPACPYCHNRMIRISDGSDRRRCQECNAHQSVEPESEAEDSWLLAFLIAFGCWSVSRS